MIRKTLLTATTGVGVLVCSCSAGNVPAGPRLSVETDLYEAGIVSEAEQKTIEHSFRITNSGSSPLKILRVRASCGCTVVEYDSLLAPGAAGTIRPSVRLEGFSGDIKKTVTVFSNDTINKAQILTITARVEPVFEISDRHIELRSNHDSFRFSLTTAKHNLVIDSVIFVSSAPSKSENGTNGTVHVRVPVSVFQEKLGEKFSRYDLTLAGPQTMPGACNGVFELYTNHPAKPRLDLLGSMGGK